MSRASSDSAYLAAAELRVRLLTFTRRTEEITTRHGVTPERYLLLLLVRVDEIRGVATTVTSLRTALKLNQSSVSRLVEGAVAAGLLDREPDTVDRRRRTLRLTEAGDARLNAVFRELGPERKALAEALGSWRR